MEITTFSIAQVRVCMTLSCCLTAHGLREGKRSLDMHTLTSVSVDRTLLYTTMHIVPVVLCDCIICRLQSRDAIMDRILCKDGNTLRKVYITVMMKIIGNA